MPWALPLDLVWACWEIICTVQCVYNAVNFLPNHHKVHPIARPLGRDMGCILWVKTVIYTSPQSLQWCMHYHEHIGPRFTALDCILLKIILKLGPRNRAPIANKSVLVQILSWHHTGDKPLPEPMMACFTECIYVSPVAPFTNMV